MSKSVIEATSHTFQSEVIQSPLPTVVDFWAPWCGPCKMIGPVLNEIATENADRYKVVKVNIDEEQELAAQYGIQAIPTLIFFKNGQPVTKHVGLLSKKEILAKLQAL
ncbi:MAG: thioredoxin [Methylacidiphilales bacterium]|nr:thioredoxin [Candidatus Methylacidiphilales bacterium]MDW8350053.1 thioredoxin [Verrucomicrobiae bacterium]